MLANPRTKEEGRNDFKNNYSMNFQVIALRTIVATGAKTKILNL